MTNLRHNQCRGHDFFWQTCRSFAHFVSPRKVCATRLQATRPSMYAVIDRPEFNRLLSGLLRSRLLVRSRAASRPRSFSRPIGRGTEISFRPVRSAR
jgi:hypothetical protein